MTPLTRKENYLNEIVGWGNTAPEKPLTPEEFFFAAILGEAVQVPEPLTRYQMYLAKIAGRNISVPKPLTRLELFLAKACGMDIETPTPITREEIFWSNYTAIVEFEVEGVPPLTYKAVEGTLENYRIYGNTVGGESVGDRTGNLWDERYDGIDDSRPDVTILYKSLKVGNGKFTLSTTTPAIGDLGKYCNLYLMGGIATGGATSEANGVSNAKSRTVESSAGYVTIGYRYYENVNPQNYETMLNTGNSVTTYEPYGYKVPVAVSNGTDTLTTPIYLPEQIRKVGDEAEYIDYGEQKMHRIGADDIDVALPALPTLTGTNVLSVGTAVQPSKVYVKYKGERQ